MRPFETAHSVLFPGRNSNVVVPYVTCCEPTPGERCFNFNEFKKSCANFSLGGALGMREVDKKKIFKEVTLSPKVGSRENSDRDLKMYDLFSDSFIYRLVLLLWLFITVAKVKEFHQYQRCKFQRKKMFFSGLMAFTRRLKS
jgi:hypothetical protein